MAVVTVRRLPEEIERALKLRAAPHGRSTVAEIRTILEAAVRPPTRVRMGAELAAFGARFGGLDLDLARNPDPAEPLSSWPGLTRPSAHERSGADGRVRPGHDGGASDPRVEGK